MDRFHLPWAVSQGAPGPKITPAGRDLLIGGLPSLQNWLRAGPNWYQGAVGGARWRDSITNQDFQVATATAPTNTPGDGYMAVQFASSQLMKPLSSALYLPLAEWTVEIIFATTTGQVILGRVDGSFDGGSDSQLVLTTLSGINVNYHRSGSFVSGVAAASALVQNGSIHVATVSYNTSDGARISLDGTPLSTTGSVPTLTDGRFCIGGDYQNDAYVGPIFEVKVFSTDLHRPSNASLKSLVETNDMLAYGL